MVSQLMDQVSSLKLERVRVTVHRGLRGILCRITILLVSLLHGIVRGISALRWPRHAMREMLSTVHMVIRTGRYTRLWLLSLSDAYSVLRTCGDFDTRFAVGDANRLSDLNSQRLAGGAVEPELAAGDVPSAAAGEGADDAQTRDQRRGRAPCRPGELAGCCTLYVLKSSRHFCIARCMIWAWRLGAHEIDRCVPNVESCFHRNRRLRVGDHRCWRIRVGAVATRAKLPCRTTQTARTPGGWTSTRRRCWSATWRRRAAPTAPSCSPCAMASRCA